MFGVVQMRSLFPAICLLSLVAFLGCNQQAPPPASPPTNPGGVGKTPQFVPQDQPIKGHDGRYVKKRNDEFPGLIHINVNQTDIADTCCGTKITKVVVKASSQSNLTIDRAFDPGFPHAVFFDSLTRTIQGPWTVLLRERHDGHGIKIKSSDKPDMDKTMVVTPLENDYLDQHDNADGTVTFSLHDQQCFKKPCEEFESILIKSKPEDTSYKCDAKDDTSCTILIGKR